MAIERKEKIVIGVNEFQVAGEQLPVTLHIDEGTRIKQISKLLKTKAERDQKKTTESLEHLRVAAGTKENLIPSMLAAVESYATIGEISDVLRSVWGEYEGH